MKYESNVHPGWVRAKQICETNRSDCHRSSWLEYSNYYCAPTWCGTKQVPHRDTSRSRSLLLFPGSALCPPPSKFEPTAMLASLLLQDLRRRYRASNTGWANGKKSIEKEKRKPVLSRQGPSLFGSLKHVIQVMPRGGDGEGPRLGLMNFSRAPLGGRRLLPRPDMTATPRCSMPNSRHRRTGSVMG